jgi:ABC-type glycerol-3-phosphate transport system substrate-binding protein
MRGRDLRSIGKIIVCGLLFLLLAACQGGPSATPSLMPELDLQTASPTATILPEGLRLTPGELEGLELELWSPWLEEGGDQLGFLVDDFNQGNNYGIQVKLTTWGGDTALLDAVESADELPDIFIASPEEAFRLQAAGLPLLAMDDYMVSSQWGFTPEELADRIDAAWQLGQSGGIQYGIPAETDAQFLFYNLTWGLELGFTTPPKNRADFLLQSCKAQKANLEDDSRENNGTGGWLIAYDSASLLAWLSASDSPIPAGAPFTFDLPATRSVLDYLKNLEVRDCSWLGKAASPYEYFTKRYALMVSGSLAEIADQRMAFTRAGSTDQWVVIPYPHQSDNSPTLVSGSSYFTIPSDATHQMAAWIFLRWMNESSQQMRMMQSGGGWPSRQTAADAYAAGLESDLVYSYTASAMRNLSPAPHEAGWSIARRLFEDAAWQLFQPETKADQIPSLLAELDATILDILSMDGK